jgi:hypothetical protein
MQLKSHSVGLLPTWHPKKGKENKHLSPANSRPLPLRQKLTVLFWQFVTAVSTLPETDTKSDKKKSVPLSHGNARNEHGRIEPCPHLISPHLTSPRRAGGEIRATGARRPPPSRRPARAAAPSKPARHGPQRGSGYAARTLNLTRERKCTDESVGAHRRTAGSLRRGARRRADVRGRAVGPPSERRGGHGGASQSWMGGYIYICPCVLTKPLPLFFYTFFHYLPLGNPA